jgi:uncharacterized metal-binding protein
MDTNEPDSLYSQADVDLMRIADKARLPGKSRVEEIKNFARLSGYKRIGIANCIGMQKEANQLKQMLDEEFEVFSIDCKTGKIPSPVLLKDDSRGLSCNPSGQANYLKLQKTDLNISFGLCMGHDIMFIQKSAAPVTTLVVKDREHKHNTFKEFESVE